MVIIITIWTKLLNISINSELTLLRRFLHTWSGRQINLYQQINQLSITTVDLSQDQAPHLSTDQPAQARHNALFVTSRRFTLSFKSTSLRYTITHYIVAGKSPQPIHWLTGLKEEPSSSVVRLVVSRLLVPNAEHLWAELGHGHGSARGWEAQGIDPARFHTGWEGRGTRWSYGPAQTRVALWPGRHHRNRHHPYTVGHISFHAELCRLVVD